MGVHEGTHSGERHSKVVDAFVWNSFLRCSAETGQAGYHTRCGLLVQNLAQLFGLDGVQSRLTLLSKMFRERRTSSPV